MKDLKLKGVKKVAGESKSIARGCYLQLNYDIKNGEVWTDFHTSLGHNSRTVYQDSNVVFCGNISAPATMLEIRARVERAVAEREAF